MLSLLHAFLFGARADQPKPTRTLAVEPLEARQLLDAAGLVEVGQQPSGSLDDKIVYIHGGHGITEESGSWNYQRPLLLGMVEDLGNQDQMSIFADYLWRAGATVVPLRPVGHQVNEAVLDNVDEGVSFDGSWSNGSSSVYFGESGETPYRYATTSLTETAVATYRPDLPEAGFYPVYAWSPAGANRATDQLYRVHHSGGATEVTVDHSRVGNGLVYLGTYHFESGTEGAVEISNQSSEPGKVVVADMIRFGNGMGDINRGNGVSGEPRENEAGLYWIEWHVERSQGIPTSAYRTSSTDRTATVSLAPRYAAYMNQATVGELSDRVFVSFHSNAGSGANRGVLALLNGNNRASAATPNMFLLANTLGRQVNDDLVAQDGRFEHDWFDRGGTVTLDRTDIEFGEINNERINDEFDATIIETGFHDNTQDAEMLRDPRVREALAKATYQGVVDYFGAVDNGATPDVDAPAAPVGLLGESQNPGEVTLTWETPASGPYQGGAATGYRIYASTDGYGFDGGTYVAGGSTASHTLTGRTAGETYYYRVVAVNAGGESPLSELVAVKPSGSTETILIVNGFDRIDRSLSPQEPFKGGSSTATRVRPRDTNSFDYAVQVAEAIQQAGATTAIETAPNEAIASGAIDLSDYDAVVWILGEESSADDTFDAAEQAAVSAYLNGGGKLLVSGAEVGWDLDNLNNGRAFYNGALRADYVSDDAGVYAASGAAGSIFDGLDLLFDDGSGSTYDVNFPDVIAAQGGSTVALEYAGGAGAAAVSYEDLATGQKLVNMAFPFETILTEESRAEAMRRVLDFFGFDTQPASGSLSLILDNDDGAPTYTETGTWGTLSGTTQRFAFIGSDNTATWSGELPVAGQAEVFVLFAGGANRASGAHYTVTVGGQSRSVFVDHGAYDQTPVSLGVFFGASGPITVTLDAGASTGADFSVVIADQVQIVHSFGPVAPNGDFNADGQIDSADYVVWRNTRGQLVTPYDGADADGSGWIDQADLDIWKATYGQTVAVSASFAEATPATEAVASDAVATGPSLASRYDSVQAVTPSRPAFRLAAKSAAPENADDHSLLLLSVGTPLAHDDLDAQDDAFAELLDEAAEPEDEAAGDWLVG